MKKIAVVTDDGKIISNHFGKAAYYRVFTIQDQKVVHDELRVKPHHGQYEVHIHNHDHSMHEDMFAPISDCEILLCGGMGEPAYQKAISKGLHIVLTGNQIDEAIYAYLSNQLISDTRRIHKH